MAYIWIKNIGPITDTGKINLTPFMFIIGEQSSGKSTFLKILCYCRWVEKRIMLDDTEALKTFQKEYFITQLKGFHKFSEEYFSKKSSIEYNSEVISIKWQYDKQVEIVLNDNFEQERHNTKLSYIPAERNLLSVIPQIEDKYRSSTFDSMFNFILEFEEANRLFNYKKPLKLPFANNMEYFHETLSGDIVRLTDANEEKELKLSFTSSGVQAALPLSVVVHYLCYLAGGPSKQTPRMIKNNFNEKLSTYAYPQLFIEEPEQHLFPFSQAELIKDIISQLNIAKTKTGRMGYAFITSHSPYILTQLNVLMKARKAFWKNSIATTKIIKEEYILPNKFYSSFFVTAKGTFKNMIDTSTGLIKGEYLDSVSEQTEEKMSQLNDIIYGNLD